MASPTSPELSIKSTDSAPGQEEERVSRRPGTALSFRLGPRGSSQPADDRRRRSIQFHVGSPDRSALPRRNGSITSPGLVRPHTNEKKVVGRGPSPPPPRYVLCARCLALRQIPRRISSIGPLFQCASFKTLTLSVFKYELTISNKPVPTNVVSRSIPLIIAMRLITLSR